jgi:hypothetical protein
MRFLNSLYILWLIRDGRVNSLEDLLLHFDQNPYLPQTSVPYLVDKYLKDLAEAGLIEEPSPSSRLKVTDLAAKFRHVLVYSLTELATHDPYASMIVSPIFGLPKNKKYAYDLFVLMPFRADLKPLYDDHIVAIAANLKMRVARADDFFTSHSIIDEVWSAISQSKFLIADCTGRNANVFYEIGIAHSTGKPVILITQNEEDVPFDLRHRRFIKYDYTARGLKEFEKQLRATLIEMRDETES